MLRITFDNYFIGTIATFKGCKIPAREPDYVSHNRYGEISSRYWYGKNKNGEYVIRASDHWSTYKDFSTNYKLIGCKNVASCWWRIKINNYENLRKQNTEIAGKAYLTDFTHVNRKTDVKSAFRNGRTQ